MRSGRAFAAVYLAPASDGLWPYDAGDDPAFEASPAHGASRGRISGGVCRTDLRNRVQAGDVILFFAGQADASTRKRNYRFAGWATVEEAVSQTNVWHDERLAGFRRYRNLLVRPNSEPGSFEHHEDIEPHVDWLWRLAKPGRHAPKKERFIIAGRGERLVGGYIEVDGWKQRPAANYVLFSPEGEGTTVLADPPVVANQQDDNPIEVWSNESFAQALRSLIFTDIERAGLRTRNT